MRVLGIDPGTSNTGYGVIESDQYSLKVLDYGTIKTSPRKPYAERLKTIYQGLIEVIDTYAPEVASVEEVFVANNPKSALKLGQARGVAILAAAYGGLSVEEYSALQIKQAVTGYGRAGKDQVCSMVCNLLNLQGKLKEGDAADALAAAICHTNSATILDMQRKTMERIEGRRK